MKFDKNKKILLGIVLVLLVGGYFFVNREQFEATEPVRSEKEVLADKISAFMTKDTKYTEYLDFLVTNKNTSYKLLDQETFYEMKTRKKNTGLLLPETIQEYMTDM